MRLDEIRAALEAPLNELHADPNGWHYCRWCDRLAGKHTEYCAWVARNIRIEGICTDLRTTLAALPADGVIHVPGECVPAITPEAMTRAVHQGVYKNRSQPRVDDKRCRSEAAAILAALEAEGAYADACVVCGGGKDDARHSVWASDFHELALAAEGEKESGYEEHETYIATGEMRHPVAPGKDSEELPRFFRAPCVHCGDMGHAALFHSPLAAEGGVG